MQDLNKVILIGRITKDLEQGNFGYVGQTAKAVVSIAVNKSEKQADGSWCDVTSFFDITIWGKTAENLKPYLTKGQQICVEAKLKQDRWEKDGQKFSKIVINADSIQLLGGKSSGKGQPSKQSVDPQTGFPSDIPF